MTTDTRAKEAAVARGGFTVGGMAKGSGMIHPDLATMLAVVTTDYPLEPGEAIEFLRPAVETSFNAISVDGEPSTNDCVILLANGASGAKRDDEAFAAALDEVCADLARQVVADGEGITVLAEITVTGADDDAQAKAIARRIATSPLVKTALFGHDANWGRVLMAAGSAPFNGGYANVDAGADHARLQRHDRPRRGRADRRRARRRRARAARSTLDLGLGDGQRELPDERPLVRLREDQRGLPDMSRIVVKVGGAVASRSAEAVLELARDDEVVRRPRRGPADQRRHGARRASRSSSSAAAA